MASEENPPLLLEQCPELTRRRHLAERLGEALAGNLPAQPETAHPGSGSATHGSDSALENAIARLHARKPPGKG